MANKLGGGELHQHLLPQIRGFGRLIAFSSADDVKYKCKDGKTC